MRASIMKMAAIILPAALLLIACDRKDSGQGGGSPGPSALGPTGSVPTSNSGVLGSGATGSSGMDIGGDAGVKR